MLAPVASLVPQIKLGFRSLLNKTHNAIMEHSDHANNSANNQQQNNAGHAAAQANSQSSNAQNSSSQPQTAANSLSLNAIPRGRSQSLGGNSLSLTAGHNKKAASAFSPVGNGSKQQSSLQNGIGQNGHNQQANNNNNHDSVAANATDNQQPKNNSAAHQQDFTVGFMLNKEITPKRVQSGIVMQLWVFPLIRRFHILFCFFQHRF
jgi:hypothetical protein